ncbi:MAG: Rossman fold protein, TIGR00730 family [Bdellovibrionales bacterium RIFOXYD1_FULL_53_11]|nr:MAG: Rossman fold protein, TIGR00730 family [Bdellovibrionales bacterium RIFOXYD1_FULL_53_11]
MKRICVYCGSNPGRLAEYETAALKLADVMLERGFTLVYGGADVGLMSVLANRLLDGGGGVIGVMLSTLLEKEVAHKGLKDLRVAPTIQERKRMMEELGDAFIAMPGGFGTLDELFEVLTLSQIGILSKPCGLLNVGGYYDGLLEFLDHAVDQKFIRKEHRELVQSAADPAELLDKLRDFKPAPAGKWFSDLRHEHASRRRRGR